MSSFKKQFYKTKIKL